MRSSGDGASQGEATTPNILSDASFFRRPLRGRAAPVDWDGRPFQALPYETASE
jgi:hypothetical protein